MVYGYARVSTKKQESEGNSIEEQTNRLKEQGCTNVVVEQYTGTTTHRPKLDMLLSHLQAGDTLKATKLDRLARTAADGSHLVKNLLEQGVNVHILNMGLIDNTPTGRLISTILFAFAEFERDMIIERTQAGKEIARTKGASGRGGHLLMLREKGTLLK